MVPPAVTQLDFTGFKRQIELNNIFSHLVRAHVNPYNGQTSPLLSCVFRDLWFFWNWPRNVFWTCFWILLRFSLIDFNFMVIDSSWPTWCYSVTWAIILSRINIHTHKHTYIHTYMHDGKVVQYSISFGKSESESLNGSIQFRPIFQSHKVSASKLSLLRYQTFCPKSHSLLHRSLDGRVQRDSSCFERCIIIICE